MSSGDRWAIIGFCCNGLSVVAPFTCLFVLMTGDVNYTFLMSLVMNIKQLISFFFYLFTADPVV